MEQNVFVLDSIKQMDLLKFMMELGPEKYDAIYKRIGYLISPKSSITYVLSHYYAKSEVDSYDFYL